MHRGKSNTADKGERTHIRDVHELPPAFLNCALTQNCTLGRFHAQQIGKLQNKTKNLEFSESQAVLHLSIGPRRLTYEWRD